MTRDVDSGNPTPSLAAWGDAIRGGRYRCGGWRGEPLRKHSLSAKALFAVMDLLYGPGRTLPKFRVLELVARVPYEGSFGDEYGRYDSWAELFRQIVYDERLHKRESESHISTSRFG